MKYAAKMWEFGSADRASTTFSDSTKIRIDASAGKLTLKSSRSVFPTGYGNWARLAAFNPPALKAWVAIDATYQIPKDATGAETGAIRWRLNNGVQDLYWTGSAWAAATTQWNTLAQIQDHLATFPTTTKTIRPVVEISTTTPLTTPTVSDVRVLFRAHQPSSAAEVLLRTLKSAILPSIAPVADMVVDWVTTGTTYALSTTGVEEGLTVTGVEAAFLHASDPHATTDVLSSYSAGTVTLTGSVAAGTQVRLRVIYAPIFALSTHQDYDADAKMPAVTIGDVVEELVIQPQSGIDFVSRSTGNGYRLPAPRQVQYRLTLTCVAARNDEALGLSEEVLRAIRANPVFTTATLAETVSILVEGESTTVPLFDEVNEHQVSTRLRVLDALIWQKTPQSLYGVRRIRLGGDMNATLEGG